MSDHGPETPFRFTFTLPPKLIAIMLLVWGAFVAAFFIWPAYQPTIIFGASSLGGLGALAGAFYLARQLVLTTQQQKVAMQQIKTEQEAAIKQKRLEIALRYLERWNNPQFHHVKIAAGKVLEIKEKKGEEAVTALLYEDATFRSNVTDILNFFEEIALAIDLEVVDEDTLKRAYSGLVHLYFMALQNFIEKRRNQFTNPLISIEVENLHKRWS